MRTVTLACLLGLLVPAPSYADPITLLSGIASVSASGTVSDFLLGTSDSYSQTQSLLAPFSTFNGSVGDVAILTDPSYSWPLSASSQAIQNSTITSDGISINGSVNAQHASTLNVKESFGTAV